MSISVLGAGAFGTALAITIADAGRDVTIWARSGATQMAADRQSPRLPDCPLPANITVTGNIAQACQADVILLAIPMQKLRQVLVENQALLAGKTLVACCKGVEMTTQQGPVAVMTTEVPDATAAILTGPSFARDIARGLPTALTLACSNADASVMLQEQLTTSTLRLYRTTDTIGAELGGALKNVIAIACGAVIGAGLGESARAALMTRGYAEMQRMAAKLGAQPETLAGLSGFGDLALTCTSSTSRNYQFGHSLGAGQSFDPTITVEGAATARAVVARAKAVNIEMPITAAVADVIDGRLDLKQAMGALLSRPLKEE